MTVRTCMRAIILATGSVVAAMAAVIAGSAHAGSPEADILRGRAVFARWCASCHGPGQHTPGTMALHFKYQGTVPPMLEQRDNLTPDFLRVFIRNGVSVMPSFRKTEVSEADIDALAAYLKDSAAGAPKSP